MGLVEVMFTKDVLLDEEAFQAAAERFTSLAEQMDGLRKDIAGLLEGLRTGFDTPAGRKFINSCKENLIKPLEDQSDVIKHVSENLTQARAKYESVFIEFAELNNTIKNVSL